MADFARLQASRQASMREVLALLVRGRLFGMGCSLADVTLLASALITPGVELCALDKCLGDLAERFGLRHRPALH